MLCSDLQDLKVNSSDILFIANPEINSNLSIKQECESFGYMNFIYVKKMNITLIAKILLQYSSLINFTTNTVILYMILHISLFLNPIN